MNFPPLDIPQTVKQVSDYLKTKCPNYKVKFGFDSTYTFRVETCAIYVKMAKDIRVDTMIGNLSHVINAGYGNYILEWPSKYSEYAFDQTVRAEPVTYDTLLEMGCID